ncbi:L-aminoadipate-semialdehyde dehydrogenase-phosphopantetheinyl transferase-like isoform X2 [Chenopodium quinoa]|uniref:L-aminoadipate-semialdehyde dehydrogenase-phosphopantetheinyl transferase-like isoform X2 n=1 Tax=Chenopodium quinoa TaxID=63459 RepID=UPI000B7891B2|nr:L-aminoadipate-semialdehyde dehydrogenase-phosphopantetheinyl transferase-like isoform X2 [Chenopodium quinoa]
MERGVQRWIVDISEWNPSPADFCAAISVLPEHQHSFVYRYVKLEDRKRALVSRLLQYALVHQVLGIPFNEIVIRSTAEGKPYVHFDEMRPEFPNFNFSVSHHGDLVAIASEPFCLVGLDVVSPQIPVKETTQQFVNSFSSYFSSKEWNKIIYAGTCDDMLQGLFRYWSLKEAFMKAIGSGLRYQLDSLEFNHINWTRISVKLHSEELRHWKFWHFELKKRHYVSVARGSPHMATENFKRTLKQTDFNEDEYGSGFNLPNASFIWRTVEQLVPN